MAEPSQPSRSLFSPFGEPAHDPKSNFDHEALKELDAIGFREILDQDPRPTFVLDLDSDYLDYSAIKTGIRPIFCNAALRLHDQLLDRVTGSSTEDVQTESAQTPYLHFKHWVTRVSEFDDSRDVFPQTFLYQGMLWTGFTSRQRWRFVSGIQSDASQHVADKSLGQHVGSIKRKANSREVLVRSTLGSSEITTSTATAAATATANATVSEPPLCVAAPQTAFSVRSGALVSTTPSFPHDYRARSSNPTTSGNTSSTTSGNASLTLASPEHGVPDWTAAKPRGKLTEHMVFARKVNWAATPLGPIETWSIEFREIANLVMRNPHPCALFWGEELTMLYNEPYMREVAGNKHPDLMGTGFSGPFSELWDGVAPIFRECARTGQSIRKENDYLPIERYGYLEETFFSWSFTPVYGGTNRSM
ncbi:hypothetical protein SLS60_007594 [Paraconiothyrium brasiliense]|uniref:PAS-like domain-containing protein n=1 Tax=Paraconiothyrium brasiliense TaxID=300254 RepID=A0ABR3R6P0_9PLEO